jgi:hypothetical protein
MGLEGLVSKHKDQPISALGQGKEPRASRNGARYGLLLMTDTVWIYVKHVPPPSQLNIIVSEQNRGLQNCGTRHSDNNTCLSAEDDTPCE